ncbi:FprA family A-type flavoprotein, partial [[Ruminococcus] gnavus]|nr:FprA family A-type flavoprotein [Mediterraneibacter gnavus]
ISTFAENKSVIDKYSSLKTSSFKIVFDNLETALQGRTLDYIVINHMEPDHCACLKKVINRYREVVSGGNAKTSTMRDQ